MDTEINEDMAVKLREEQTRLIKLIEALAVLKESKEWNVLKELVFDKTITSIERQLLQTTLAPKIDTDKLYKLQGEWVWAKQYSDTDRFIDTLKKQLEALNKKLK